MKTGSWSLGQARAASRAPVDDAAEEPEGCGGGFSSVEGTRRTVSLELTAPENPREFEGVRGGVEGREPKVLAQKAKHESKACCSGPL